jgi:Arc/MetJ-type ribon-helix-helix transcriptional regulator
MTLTIDLGTPFEATMDKLLDRGYAANKSELIRQALILYDRAVDEEEIMLVRTAVESMVADQKSRKRKTYTLEEIEKEFDL